MAYISQIISTSVILEVCVCDNVDGLLVFVGSSQAHSVEFFNINHLCYALNSINIHVLQNLALRKFLKFC